MGRLYITNATNVGNLSVNIQFSDNTSRVVNIGDFIRRHPHPQYNKYLDEKQYDSIHGDCEELVRILVSRCKKLDGEELPESVQCYQ